MIGGALVQLAAVKLDFEWAVNRRAVEGLGGLAVDGIVSCTFGTMARSTLGDNLGPLVIFAVASALWSAFIVFALGKHFFQEHWFEHAISEFGETQGNAVAGFIMVDMDAPKRTIDVAAAYGYRQLITRPFIGGGFISAVSIPVIIGWGLTALTVVTAVIAVALSAWGSLLSRSSR